MAGFTPIMMRWDGEAFKPLSTYWQKTADKELVIGSVYSVCEDLPRSMSSHNHQFAEFYNLYDTLPEQWHEKFPVKKHFRQYALIQTGWYNERSYDFATSLEGQRMLAALVSSHADQERYIEIFTDGNRVLVRKARSQKMRGLGAMNKADFQRSKSDIMEFAANLANTTMKDALAYAGAA